MEYFYRELKISWKQRHDTSQRHWYKSFHAKRKCILFDRFNQRWFRKYLTGLKNPRDCLEICYYFTVFIHLVKFWCENICHYIDHHIGCDESWKGKIFWHSQRIFKSWDFILGPSINDVRSFLRIWVRRKQRVRPRNEENGST